MTRKSGSSVLTKVAAFLLIIVLLGVIAVGVWLGVETQGFKDWTYFNGEQQTEQPAEEEQPEEEQPSDVTDGEGNEMMSGTSYALPTAMVYSATTRESASASEGVTVTATVLPETAIDKSVTWNVAFANAESVWASGKTATDYLTVTPDEGDSRIAVLTCNEAFGEQIILTCASVSDPTKTATCTVDYAQKVTNYTLSFGDVACNFGGETSVTVEMDYLADEFAGGTANGQMQTNDVYTLADEFTVSYKLTSCYAFLPYTNDLGMGMTLPSWLAFGYKVNPSTIFDAAEYDYSTLESYNVAENGLYFGFSYFAENLGLCAYTLNHPSNSSMQTSQIKDTAEALGGTYDTSTLIEYYNAIKEGETPNEGVQMFDLTVTITGTYTTQTFTTTFVMGGYTYENVITDISLDKSEVVFS